MGKNNFSATKLKYRHRAKIFNQVHRECICRKSELLWCVTGSHLAVVCLLDVLSMQFLTDCVWSEGKLMRGKGDIELGELCVCLCECLC